MQREPGLLTHREPDEALYEDDYYDDDEPELTEEEERRLRKKKIWKRVRIAGFVALGLMIIAPVAAIAIAYPLVSWPRPEDVAAEQNKTITLLWSDGSEMTKITKPGENRTMLTLEEVPDHVRKAVLAAEDAGFYDNPGFDAKAILRAVWIQATGGSSGGSGLTQQYIKKATGKDAPTLERKFTELVKAYKMSNESDHDTILTAYLNTVHFGRGADGMKAAAQVYYNKPMSELTPSEAALIAGMIQTPSKSENVEYQQERWTFVMNQMLHKGWIDQAYRDAQQLPTPLDFAKTRPGGLEGPLARVQEQIEAEVDSDEVGLTMDKAQKIGVTIHTTIDKNMQQAANDAVAAILNGQPEDLRTSLSSIDPNTGAVVAYWAGKDGLQGLDYAKGTLQEAGSSFKPFDLVGALKMGKGIGDTYDGTSPRTIAGQEIRNASDKANSCGKQCPIKRAMELSLNTVFYDMVANDVKPQNVAKAAHEAGIPEQVNVQGKSYKTLVGENDGFPNAGISLGGDHGRVRPFDMASAYATFAARGVYRKPFFITKIEGPDKEILYQHTDKSVPAFDTDANKSRDIADNVTETLKKIPELANIACGNKRECAGKTGTHELDGDINQNSKAWMVGYTPSLSTSVWIGKDAGNVAIKDKGGKAIFGGGLPGQIWKKYMDAALNGKQVEKFPTNIKKLGQFEAPKPTQSSNPSSNPTTSTTGRSNDNDPTTSSSKPTKPTRPTGCGIVGCPTSSDEIPPPDPITNGRDPNDN